jgi:hypothetical protein
MEAKGFDFSRYSNPLASIHVVLQRLVKSGQVKSVPRKAGKKAYQWITAIDNLLTVLNAVSTRAAQQSQRKALSVNSPSVETAKLSAGSPQKR